MDEIKVDDLVIYADGKKGKVTEICECDECRRRGFCEPTVLCEDYTIDYITIYDKENNFKRFFVIGKTLYGNKVGETEIIEQIDKIEEQRTKLKEQNDQLRKQLYRIKHTMIDRNKE